ncbi:MAG: aminopeptidase P family protein [Rickettsiales bacterium]|nr:aminopeptidase P family protein [Rickettsiales bacterium]
MLNKLKKLLKDQKIDYLLLPNSDEYFLEYLPKNKKKVQALTGFSGSNAFVVFGLSKSYFFTDGRYLLQAREELDMDEFEIVDMAKKMPFTFLEEELKDNEVVALDSKLFNVVGVKKLQEVTKNLGASLRFLDENDDIKGIFQKKLQNVTQSRAYNLDKRLVGVDSLTKRRVIAGQMSGELMLVAKPENICWLLNLRGSDLENTPLVLAYGILFKDGSFDLFIDEKKITNLDDENLINVNFIQENCLDLRINVLSKKYSRIQIDKKYCNYFIYQMLENSNFEIVTRTDPIELAKAIKSDIEIRSIKKTHELDGLALTKFLCWLDLEVAKGREIDEILAAKKLLELRKKSKAFLAESFPAISAFGSNGSVIHYHPSVKTNKKIDDSSLYLIDSGGQYLDKELLGTTDVTRTVSFGKATEEQILDFTRVLKGHIALARVKFSKGTTGCNLDILARFHLLQDSKDYAHGTGHGVGCFLSVHEGPCNISKRSHQELLPNMVLSNEPGFYKDGKYGIRIENLVVVKEIDESLLGFETISLAPIDPKLIDFKMLTYPEKKWLKRYHENILDVVGGDLSGEEKDWLEKIADQYC